MSTEAREVYALLVRLEPGSSGLISMISFYLKIFQQNWPMLQKYHQLDLFTSGYPEVGTLKYPGTGKSVYLGIDKYSYSTSYIPLTASYFVPNDRF